MYHLKVLSTSFHYGLKNVYAELLGKSYNGVSKVPYLNVGLSEVLGHNIIFTTIDESNHTVTGALVLHLNPVASLNGTGCKNWVSSIGVHPEYRGRGLSKVLIREFFKFCVENNISGIEQSSYTEEGNERVRHLFEKYAERYPEVGFIDVLNNDEVYVREE